jgi:tetratricopeptide (TPR) repeat protein
VNEVSGNAKSKLPNTEVPSARAKKLKRLFFPAVVLLTLVAAALIYSRGHPLAAQTEHGLTLASKRTTASASEADRSAYAGSASCRQCHPHFYALWSKENHGLAERPVSMKLDQAAFVPARSFRAGSQTNFVALTNGSFFITSVGLSGHPEAHRVERVIGNDPLREFLVSAPGGRWQVMEAAYDPHRNEWFDVFGNENRRPGEWGHWTGRGMNWNSMCAACHNTALQKNYDEAADSYHTTMAEPRVSCEACHGPLKAHVDWERKYHDQGMVDPTMPKRTPAQIMDTCASCHARRVDLTGDFKPGDSFFNHYDLSIVDHSGLFYPDGQVHDEDYEFSAFMGSKMHQAGVTCLDCHPRSANAPKLQGNAMCLRCHGSGYMKAPIINPEEHSHHAVGSTGDECVGCHMPVTVYMQRHPRHDHGLTIPDPLLTKKFGIPNACNRCHIDKDTDWALAAVEKWYGSKMDRPTRERAEWIALARQGNSSAREPLVTVLTGETNPYWQAVAAGLLDQWVDDPRVADALTHCLDNTNPLVRVNSIRSLEPLAEEPGSIVAGKVRRLLDDPCRDVRISAAWVLRSSLDTNTPAGRDLWHYLEINADQPAGQMQKGEFYFARGDLPAALEHYQKAVAWDPNSAPIHSEFAVVLSAANHNQEAIAQMEAACQLAPREAEYRYRLGLAWNEVGNLSKTIESLEAAVKLDPQYARAWYNLGLAQNQAGQVDAALEALTRAETLSPTEANIPYARATILAHAGRIAEARTAAQRALTLQPDFPAAAQLLQALSR